MLTSTAKIEPDTNECCKRMDRWHVGLSVMWVPRDTAILIELWHTSLNATCSPQWAIFGEVLEVYGSPFTLLLYTHYPYQLWAYSTRSLHITTLSNLVLADSRTYSKFLNFDLQKQITSIKLTDTSSCIFWL